MNKKLKKKDLVGTCLVFLTIAFLIPFLIRKETDSILSVFNTAITSTSAVATVATLFIAIHLYQRFGLESRFISEQTDKVLEIVDILKGQFFMGNTNKYSYLLGTSREKIETTMKSPFYQSDKNKIVLINEEDFLNTWVRILEIKRSYWLPKKIKKKIEFMDIFMFDEVENPFDEKYIRIQNISKKKNLKKGEWLIAYPTFTFNDYNKNYYELIKSIEKWLKQHSDIKIDLNMNETKKYKAKN